MLRLLAWLTTGFVLALAALILLSLQALEMRPLVTATDELSAASISRARAILRHNDPRRMAPGSTRDIRLSGPDLEALLNFAARRGIKGNAALTLRQDGADIGYTAALPALFADIGPGRFINVRARLGVSTQRLEVEQVRIGRIPLPAALVEVLLVEGLRYTHLAPELNLLTKTVTQVAITPEAATLTYVWQPELLDSVRTLAVTPTQRERLAAAHRLLVDSINPIARTRRKADLADVLGPLLQAAGDQAGASRRSDAYRDALLVTALHLSGHNIAFVIPEAARWPRPLPLALSLRGRGDLAQHFAISAAIAAWGGESLANVVGLDKEVSDSRHGSGFSFVDLAADRAGTRLGELAVRNPERLAAAIKAGLEGSTLLPPIDGLPESMMASEFHQRFGSTDAPAYRQMSDEIDRRIQALALFR